MTLSTPSAGHAPALPAGCGLTDAGPRTLAGLDTMEGRIQAWCAWFGMEPPKIKRNRKREMLVNDEIVSWLYASGGTFDWLVVGDMRTMALAYRKKELEERQFIEALKR